MSVSFTILNKKLNCVFILVLNIFKRYMNKKKIIDGTFISKLKDSEADTLVDLHFSSFLSYKNLR